MVSRSTDAILSQMRQAGKPRTTTQETVQEQPAPPIDIGTIAMVLAMLLGKSQPAGLGNTAMPPVRDTSNLFNSVFGAAAPAVSDFGANAPAWGEMDPYSILAKIAGV